VVDAPSVVITHLGEVLRRHAPELLSREDLKRLVDKVRETSPSVVDELIPNTMTMGAVHRVIGLLLEEHVPISNLTRVLESLATHAPAIKDPLELTDRVRVDLGRVICDRLRDAQARVSAIVLDPRLEMDLRRALHERNLTIEPARLEKLIVVLANEWRRASLAGKEVGLLTDGILRRPLKQAIARSLPDLAVIAYQEIPKDMILNPTALVKPEDLG
jgi:flagellar biosynthesis protein FlhA